MFIYIIKKTAKLQKIMHRFSSFMVIIIIWSNCKGSFKTNSIFSYAQTRNSFNCETLICPVFLRNDFREFCEALQRIATHKKGYSYNFWCNNANPKQTSETRLTNSWTTRNVRCPCSLEPRM
jgi:hypothetical protein